MVRRYEAVDASDDQSDYTQYSQPRRRRAKDFGRYEYEPPSLQHRQDALKAQKIQVYTNGAQYEGESGLHFSFSRKQFPRIDSLMDFINTKLRTKIAVRFLFKWPTCEEVKQLEDIEELDRIFVAADSRKLFKGRKYGGVPCGGDRYGGDTTAFSEKYSRGSHDSRSTMRSKPSPTSQYNSSSSRAPIHITVISNMDRGSKQSMIINPQSESFEKIFETVEELINIPRGPVTALYPLMPPHSPVVNSFSTLRKAVRLCGDTFYACGQEGPPEELYNQRHRSPNRSPNRETSPMRNGYGQPTPRRQVNGYGDYGDEQRGRQYNYNDRQRGVGGRNQPDGEDGSPTIARDRRGQPGVTPRGQQGVTPRGKPTPRGQDDSKTPRRGQDDRQQQNGRRDDEDSDHSRSSTPEEVNAQRIGDMEALKDNLDDNVEF